MIHPGTKSCILQVNGDEDLTQFSMPNRELAALTALTLILQLSEASHKCVFCAEGDEAGGLKATT